MLTTSLLLAALLAGQVAGADGDSGDDADADAWIGEHLLAEAADYKVFVKRDDNLTELTLEEPLLHYFDSLTNVPHGYLLIWTRKSRPEACASFWAHRLPNGLRELHEFQSLSEQPLRAKRGNTEIWHPDATGVAWRALMDAPVPSSVAARRLAEMRRQARRFTAAIYDNSGRRQVRLLSQPVYRYACPEEQVLDGAVFVYAKGTNPELLLLLEARGQEEETAWHYALARMTIRQIEVLYDGDDLKTIAGLGGRTPYRDPRQPYYEFRRPLPLPSEPVP